MARARWIKPEFYTDTRVCRVSDQAALVFPALWVECDDGGVCPGDPRVIYGRRFIMRPTWTIETVERALDELVDAGLVLRFRHRGEPFLFIPDFADKQGISGSHVKQWRHLGKAHKEVTASVRTSTNGGGTESHGGGTESDAGGTRLPPKPLPSPSPSPSPSQQAIAEAVAGKSKSGAAPPTDDNPMIILGPLIREHLYRGDPPKDYEPSRCANICKKLLASGYSVDDLREAILVVPQIRAGKVPCDETLRRWFLKQPALTMRVLNDRWGSGSVIEQLLHIVRKGVRSYHAGDAPSRISDALPGVLP